MNDLLKALEGLLRYAEPIPEHVTDNTFITLTCTARSMRRAREAFSAAPSTGDGERVREALGELARIAWFDEQNIGGSKDTDMVDISIRGNYLFAVPLGVFREVRAALSHPSVGEPFPQRQDYMVGGGT